MRTRELAALTFIAAIAVAMIHAPAHAVTLLSIDHDGTIGDENNPFDTFVLDGGADWTYTTDGARSIMTALDNSTSGANRLIVVQEDGVNAFTDVGTPAGKGWVFEIELEILAGASSSVNQGFAFFGVRSENEAGKQAWIALNDQGGTGGSGRIGFASSSTATFIGTPVDYDVDSLIGDGQYHNFKIIKYDDGGTPTVDVYLDSSLVLSSDYSSLPNDVSSADIQAFASSTPTPSSQVNIDRINFTLYDNLLEAKPSDVLVDINADGTNRNATTSDFESAAGLANGTFAGNSITFFPNNNPSGGAYSQTVGDITIAVSDITSDADGWFGAGSDNNLLEDGLFHRDTTGDPSSLITLSGEGLGLEANREYELYLFAGREQGHETDFTFDPSDLDDPSGGITISTSAPNSGDETLGTALFTFITGSAVPSELVIRWDGAQNINGNQDAVFSGFALREVGVVPTPAALPAGLVAMAILASRRRR